jgi:hypothetical protein
MTVLFLEELDQVAFNFIEIIFAAEPTQEIQNRYGGLAFIGRMIF